MAKEENTQIVTLHNDYYRDSFGKLLVIIGSLFVAIIFLIGVSLYLHYKKPAPTTFLASAEWRVQPPVPLTEPYLSIPEVLQWVSNVIPNAFAYDFANYNDQLKKNSIHFTAEGWKIFLNQLNIYVNYNNVQAYKLFVNSVPTSAPYIINQGLLSGRYAWWIQMPINIDFVGYDRNFKQSLILQILVVRVSTLNNLNGIGIENVIVTKSTGGLPQVGADNDNNG